MSSNEKNTVVLHQTLAMLPLFLIEFMMGVGFGWIAPVLHQLREPPEAAFTSEDCAWIASLHYVGRGAMAILSVFTIDRLGRNLFLIFAAFICFSMWVMVYLSLNLYLHYAVRIFFGISIGLHDAAAGMYICENCSPTLRGIFSGFFLACFYLGQVGQFVLAEYVSYEWLAIINSVFGLIALLSTFFLVEPPHFLIMKGKFNKAEKNYEWLNGSENPQTKKDFEDVKEYVIEEKSRSFNCELLRSKEVYKSIRIVLLTHLLCYACGYAAVNSFVTILLSGSTGFSNTQLTIFFGLVQFFVILLSAPFIDIFKRRTLFLTATAFIIILHTATATLYYVGTIYSIPHFHWILFVLLTSYMSIHGMFIFPLNVIIRGELLPQNVKALGSTLGGVFSAIGGFIGAKTFLPISDSFGTQTNFILFSLVSLFMFLHVYFDLPETKGKTLIEIQRELKGVKDTPMELT